LAAFLLAPTAFCFIFGFSQNLSSAEPTTYGYGTYGAINKNNKKKLVLVLLFLGCAHNLRCLNNKKTTTTNTKMPIVYFFAFSGLLAPTVFCFIFAYGKNKTIKITYGAKKKGHSRLRLLVLLWCGLFSFIC
jgi:hypothetical protein